VQSNLPNYIQTNILHTTIKIFYYAYITLPAYCIVTVVFEKKNIDTKTE